MNISLQKTVGKGYADFWNTKKRYRVCKGSRGSKKSKTTALNMISRLYEYPQSNGLCVRRYSNTLRDSVYSDLKWAIHKLGVDKYFECTVSPMQIIRRSTGQKILFRGLDDGLKITSISVDKGVLCFVWIEEAYELTNEDDFNKKFVPMSEMEPVISELLKNGSKTKFIMTGDSMLPFLHSRKDVAVLESAERCSIKKYDVLFYKRDNGQFVLHRVVAVRGDLLDMCGDAQYTVEKGVPKSAVIGKLCGYYSYRRPERFLSCEKRGYRMRAALWVKSRPLRHFLFRVKRKLNLSR